MSPHHTQDVMRKGIHMPGRTLYCLSLILFSCALVSRVVDASASPRASVNTSEDGLPAWVNEVGARREPQATRLFVVNTFGAKGDGVKNSTSAIQQTIDACSKAGGGIVTFRAGKYVTGALFLKSDVHLRLDRGVTLLGSQDDADYPLIWT